MKRLTSIEPDRTRPQGGLRVEFGRGTAECKRESLSDDEAVGHRGNAGGFTGELYGPRALCL
jgi:hypothetical protein